MVGLKMGGLIIAALAAIGILTGALNRTDKISQTEPLYKDQVMVLMYHNIDPFFKSGATITPQLFHDQLEKIKENHFNVISMKEFEEFAKGNGDVPPNALLITFDDGYESFYKYAYPELKNWGFPATNFVIVGCTDQPYLSHLPHLKWDEIKEMKAANMTFYSHTYNQHDYVAINPSGYKKPVLLGPTYIEEEARKETEKQYEDRVRADLSLAQKRLKEELGDDQNILCFPYGAYNEKVIGIAKSLGMDLFFTIQPGINERGSRVIYRINGGSPKITPDDLIRAIKLNIDPKHKDVISTSSFTP